MRVSVIVPTYNRLGRLRRVLAALESQTYPLHDFEVVVVSDGATDGTNAFLAEVQTPLQLVPIIQSNQGVAAARNSGVAVACGEFVLFVDDDVVPSPALIAEHLHAHAATNDDIVVLGPMLTPTDFTLSPWVRWEQDMLYKQYDDMQAGRWIPTARQFYTGNSSLARQHVLDAGGFDAQFRRAEDVELAYRLAERGLRFVFNPNAVGYHYAERSFQSWMTTPYLYGRNDVIFARDKGQSWLLPTVCHEFYQRQLLIQWLVRLCVGRPWLMPSVVYLFTQLAGFSVQLGTDKLGRKIYSAIFNLRYFQGLAEELGGRKDWLAAINGVATDSERIWHVSHS